MDNKSEEKINSNNTSINSSTNVDIKAPINNISEQTNIKAKYKVIELMKNNFIINFHGYRVSFINNEGVKVGNLIEVEYDKKDNIVSHKLVK